MPTMWAPHLTLTIFPEPGDERVAERIGDLLLERGARSDGDGFFVERRRRMLIQRAPRSDVPAGQIIEIVMPAGPLGDPGYSRREMAAFGRHLIDLLVAVVDRTRPLYGGIGVEQIFPTPAELRRGLHTQGFVTDPFFVRRDLLERLDLAAVLAGEFRRTIDCQAGTVFASWWPFVDGKDSTPGGLSIWDKWAGGQVLGRVAARYLLERERAAGNEQ